MNWFIILCSFLLTTDGDPQCDRGLSFETVDACIDYRDAAIETKLISEAYCEYEIDDVKR